MKNIPELSPATAVVNYILNRSMPFLCAGGLLFYACGYDSLIPYVVLGLMWFASKFSFDCGFATAILESQFNVAMKLAVSQQEVEDIDDENLESKEKKQK